MLEVFSKNIAVAENTEIPLKNVTLLKGATATINNDTITLQKCGVYCISVDTSVQVPVGSEVSFQLYRENVAQPQAIKSLSVNGTVSEGAYDLMDGGFQTLVQVPRDNTPSPCTDGISIQFINGATATTYEQFHVTVTKLV